MIKKRVYDVPLKATYKYEVMTIDRRIETYSTRVTVIAETDKSFQVMLHEPIRMHFVGDVLWVMRKNISVDVQATLAKKVEQKPILSNQFPFTEMPTVDVTNEWWQD